MNTLPPRSAPPTTPLRLAIRQVARGGVLHTLRAAAIAAAILVDLRDFQRLRRLLADTAFLDLQQLDPLLCFRYLDGFLHRSSTRATRLRCLIHHYAFLRTRLAPDFMHRLLTDSPLLWKEQRGNLGFAIRLSYPKGVEQEGALRLTLEMNGRSIAMIVVTIVPAKVFGLAGDDALFIGNVQGLASLALTRECTRGLGDVAPPALLLAAAQGLAQAIHAESIVGVSNDEHVLSARILFQYDEFWRTLQATETTQRLFLLPVDFPRQDISKIEQKRRKRTLGKRAFKARVAATVQQRFLDEFGIPVADMPEPRVPAGAGRVAARSSDTGHTAWASEPPASA